jgi:predicted GNAT family acetyltransferase
MLHVRHDVAAGRFEADVDGGVAHADYHLRDGVMHIVYTEVPAVARGRGIAAAVVAAALAHAREQGLKVQPMCSYVRAYMRRHPEAADLLPPA